MMLSMSILLLVTACKKNETKALSAEEQSNLVKSLDSMYSHHIEKQQADSLVNTYLAEAIILTPGEDEVKGINAIKEWYSNAFAYGLKTLSYTTTSIMGDENHLIEVGSSTAGLQIGDSDTLTYEEYKYIHVWVKQPNGKYKLSRDMWNQNQAK